jgi:UV DNA damage endonuclease
MLNIGYACIAVGVPGTQLRTCRLSNATNETLSLLAANNLAALETMLAYNIREGIHLFRISSDLIPLASHPSVNFPWRNIFAPQLQALGKMIHSAGMRVSMHPGQYTLLNAKDADITQRAIEDIRYHAALLDALETDQSHKIVLHLGGVYGDKAESIRRFKSHFLAIEPDVRQRIVIENDDRHYHIGDVLDTAAALGIPAVFDNLHHRVNSCGGADGQWIAACRPTWDCRQKIHYSQQAANKRPGAHSQTIHIQEFLQFRNGLADEDVDIMLEVKDKNLSAIKCLLCASEKKSISRLEREWSRYKYAVLERDPAGYTQIRDLLKDKAAYPAEAFYCIVERALEKPFDEGPARNAMQHVWGYFKGIATEKEKQRFAELTATMTSADLKRVKELLFSLSKKYHIEYLTESLCFQFN